MHPIKFTLVVDDFDVQYVGKEHAQHLIDALETDYTVSKDWTGGLYYGITLNWDYENKHLTCPCLAISRIWYHSQISASHAQSSTICAP
jgi:hypothetical protein